jgi:hypothetical protein
MDSLNLIIDAEPSGCQAEARQKPLVRRPITDGLGEVTISGVPDYSCFREGIFTTVKAIAVEEDVWRTKGCSRPAVRSGFRHFG